MSSVAPISSIVLLGAGNVGTHLGQQLHQKGLKIAMVWSRSFAAAHDLGRALDVPFSDELSTVPADADLYLLAVSDQAIEPVAAALRHHLPDTAFLAHTSGATAGTVLSPHVKRYGVFYPLQTFSKVSVLDFTAVPFCVHAANEEDQIQLQNLAQVLVSTVYIVDDEQRRQLHLAAIFVNNFTNYLQYISSELVAEHQLPAELLQPLLTETVAKLATLSPAEAQTGPAIRGDEATIARHLEMLRKHPSWAKLYALLSEGIQRDLTKG